MEPTAYASTSASVDGMIVDRVATMRRHIEQLCRDHQIACWIDRPRCHGSHAFRELEEIHIAPIRSAISYATVLHEIGHICGRHQWGRRVLVRERWA